MKTKEKEYKDQLQQEEETLRKQKKKSRRFLIAKLIFFLLFVVGLYMSYVHANTFYLIGGIFSFLIYLFMCQKDVVHQYKMDWTRNKKSYLTNELKALSGDYTPFRAGEGYIDPNHPFTFDLDVFGLSSLFQRINRTLTTKGEECLAAHLQNLPTSNKAYQAVLNRQEAIQELAEKFEWRLNFLSLPLKGEAPLKASLSYQEKQKEQKKLMHVAVPFFLAISIASFFTAVGYSIWGTLSSSVPVLIFVVQLLVTSLFTRSLMKQMQEIGRIHEELKNYLSLLQQVTKVSFQTKLNQSIQCDLVGKEKSALTAFKQLSVISNQLDRRANILLLLLFNGVFFQDIFLIRRCERWKKHYLNEMESWMQQIGELDALVSMATYQFNTPYALQPQISDSPTFVYQAEQLYHPFLKKSEAVANDFQMDERHFYIITGANMAGKSTFLRTLGVNYILALNGMPVCAQKYEVSFFHLFTSMRTSDNLSAHISYFNAELLRLKALIDNCKENAHTFIILDEILKGTNSVDKLKGSQLFLQEMAKQRVSGVVATHDLQLSKLENTATNFHNYCFEIALSEEISYSYKIKKGIAKNMNATYLLQSILKG